MSGLTFHSLLAGRKEAARLSAVGRYISGHNRIGGAIDVVSVESLRGPEEISHPTTTAVSCLVLFINNHPHHNNHGLH